MTHTPRVLAAGLSCLDHLWQVDRFPPTHSRTHASNYHTQGGGPAATAAVTVARLGGEVELWALHGDDEGGRILSRELQHYGVDISQLRVCNGGKTFVSAVLVDPQGERYIFPYRGELCDDAEGWNVDRIANADAVLVDARHPQMNRLVLETARAANVPTVGDFSNTRHWELTKLVDYLIVSEECAREVAGDVTGDVGVDDLDAALAALRQFDDQLVGVTLGEQGFVFNHAGQTRHIPALPIRDVVDTTGAGDVFHGAYAYAVASGRTPDDCGLFASVTAARACLGVGRSTIPTAAEVAHLLEKKTAKEMDEMRWT
ncbi:MAG: PfkB family carbohydrate kinase [Trueperaceae bacterium]|nr:PfkB family carbohydrate kinase [Trueperaceae bacterium]